ncbi:metal ABC transporter permease [Cardiobacterium valvarum]|uniref:High-affinity zinc uptake system membrane protein ZnuB n=1 Tax=Cardiobacterium valvarum F0432 TaxID=797473 RepID=G9ZBH4_9GAMM|nr:metal ABC transporter permease [Cardiobacterium valvarum]EHM56102.1 putative high-affinity zinc transporter membrane component [Cardiobacterium valvarum F0432]
MFLNLILIPWLCALITGIIAAPIGALIAWRRLVYFGEALSHASLLGIALALKSGLPPVVGIWSITLLLVALLYLIEKDGRENPSNILGSLSHIALALGMVLLSTMENIRTDLINYLFGDILATGAGDLANITIVALIGGALLYRLWQPLILMTISPAIARTEHPRARHYDLAFLLLIGLFIGTTVQYFGLLLVIALLIIPANTANRLAKTPEQSAVLAAALAALSTTLGTVLAWTADLPLSPAIISIAGGLYFAVLIATHQWRRPQHPPPEKT